MTSSRADSPKPTPSTDKVVVDPTKGGAVSPKASGQQSKALEVPPGHWIWDGLVKVLEVDLFSAAWEVRHGAAMALRELLKTQGKYGGTKGMSDSYRVPHSVNILHQLISHETRTRLRMNDGATTWLPNCYACFA